ncbi:MAG: NADH-quinone oxidoreductase subunit J [bacterium]|nr:NADH-quinone oxidoreductase subunit J [bacterium]
MQELKLLLIIPTAIFSILSVTLKNIFYSALSLILTLFCVALIYLGIGSSLLFAVQIVVYVGGIAVLILFIVMLAGNPTEYKNPQQNKLLIPAGVVSAIVFFLLNSLTLFLDTPVIKKHSLKEISNHLLYSQVISFEGITLLIFAAIIGVVLFTRK